MQLKEEIDQILAIYPDICTYKENECVVIAISNQNKQNEIQIKINFNVQYPDEFIFIQFISCPFSQCKQSNIIEEVRQQIELGQSYLLLLVNLLINLANYQIDNTNQEIQCDTEEQNIEMYEKEVPRRRQKQKPTPINKTNIQVNSSKDNMIVSPPVILNKSTFFTSTIKVTSVNEVNHFVQYIDECPQCQNATHNMCVWRIKQENGEIIEGYDEDGEKHAGMKMLFLMQKMKVVNRVAICTRFWGGILLGPVRFKIINESVISAFNIVKQNGQLELE